MASLETSLSKMKFDFSQSDSNNRYDNLNEQIEDEEKKKSSYFKFEFYQKYFNVNTTDVLYRIIGSMTPTFNQSFLINRIRPNPDLYGPFWICISLIFTIAIAGNIVSFLHNFGSEYKWHTDFHKVTSSAATIITYWWLMPTILYCLLRWTKTATEFTFIEILCIYGYSLFIYIPIALLWMININILQWILVGLAIVLSGSVLAFTFWPVFSADSNNKKIAICVTCMILILHAALGLSFMLYFFHYPNTQPFIPVANLNISNATNNQLVSNGTTITTPTTTILFNSTETSHLSSTTTIRTTTLTSFLNSTLNSTAAGLANFTKNSILNINSTSVYHFTTDLNNNTNSSIQN